METEEKNPESAPEWEDRTLCPDGNCIGIIGPDGRCGECGIQFSSPEPGQQTTTEIADIPSSNNEPDAESDSLWENRILCPDGNCIGIIGPDGRCRECGKEGN
ncbi:MAG: hypothetical protein KKH97_05560 [Proteobacteria bacterium]|nr:hypothetical protein [Pseudomonadota bacterium]MBU1712186.1 hypothetical protein [Pseudomonadota bacterium]